MKFYSGVIDVGFTRSLSKVYFPEPIAAKGGFRGDGKCALARGSLAPPSAMLFASKLAVLK